MNYDRVALATAVDDVDRIRRDLIGAQLRTFWNRLRANVSYDLGRALSLVIAADNLLDHQLGEPDNVTVFRGARLPAAFARSSRSSRGSMMSEGMQFTPAHISSIAARAAQLEQIGEDTQDPHALVRAARLYTLAVRIADDIHRREALPFMQSDLARVREELTDTSGSMTLVFREVAAGIEQRLAHETAASRRS